jgi:GNAT superfamily N-acetyltransferase
MTSTLQTPKVEYLDLATAANLLGREEYNRQIAWMCRETYQIWWDTYFKHNQEEYPSWQTLYDLDMALTDQLANTPRNKLVNGHIKGFVAVADRSQIIGYINLIYNEATPEELQTLIIPPPLGQDTIWASDLFVWPEYRSQGVALKLMYRCVEWLQQEYLAKNKIDLDTQQLGNTNSHNEYLYLCCENHLVELYAKKGCELISSAPDEFGWQYMRYRLN